MISPNRPQISRVVVLATAACLCVIGSGLERAHGQIATKTQGKTVDIRDRLAAHRFFLDSHEALRGRSDVRIVDRFVASLRNHGKRDAVLRAIEMLDPVFSEDELRALVYWKWLAPNREHAKTVLVHWVVYRALILRDLIEHPLADSSAATVASARAAYRELTGAEFDAGRSYRAALERALPVAGELAKIDDPRAFAAAVLASKLFTVDVERSGRLPRPYVLDPIGFVPGNRVELISENDQSEKRIEWVNRHVIFGGGRIDWDAPFMVMPGVGGKAGHPVFNDPIFKRIREMVDSSRESVFVNIFLFGGTMGATLARHMIDHAVQQAAMNPRYRLWIMHDYATNYGLGAEMLPVFEYIRDRIAKEPAVGRVVALLQANIQRHLPGIPFGITNFIPKTPEVFKVIEKMDTYYESKIDHSKVLVVDPNSDRPKAYFGSKNWTDHSGSYYYDDAIYVEGPAAAIVQQLYFDDVDAALTRDPNEQAWFYFKDKGLDNRAYLPRRDAILNEFRVKRSSFPAIPVAKTEAVRFAEANVDGRIKSARNILIDMIRFAKKNVYMEQLFLYDKYVIDALLKRKHQVPSLDVRILADHNGNFGMNGFPNTIFIGELQSAGVHVRARRTMGVPFVFPNGDKREFHQENHRKLTSVDGRVLLGGSSNLNPDTLQGSFREFGAQIFDREQIARFERAFLRDWDDSSRTMEMSMQGWRFALKNKAFSERTSALINAGVGTLIRSKDLIEERENRP